MQCLHHFFLEHLGVIAQQSTREFLISFASGSEIFIAAHIVCVNTAGFASAIFLLVTWLPQGQLWATDEEIASLTQCLSLCYIYFDPKVTRSLMARWSLISQFTAQWDLYREPSTSQMTCYSILHCAKGVMNRGMFFCQSFFSDSIRRLLRTLPRFSFAVNVSHSHHILQVLQLSNVMSYFKKFTKILAIAV